MGKESELITSIKEGNSQYVRKVLQKYRKSSKKNASKKSTINVADTEGFTALHHAALLGDVEIIMAIIEMEGDPNSRDKQGMTPIHMAAWAGKDAALKALLENRGLPNLPSFSGDTPLHLAAQHGYAGCAKILLDNHADGAFRNSNSETPLDLACQFGHSTVVKHLLMKEKVVELLTSEVSDARYKSPLHLSAKSGHDDIVQCLLEAGVDVNIERPEGTPLHQAALYGKKDAVLYLLKAGADVHRRNSNGLMALDLVNRFTASRAGLEIKQMLREAAGEKVAYARAVSDYNNQYDDTCLSFKNGDSIAVLEQNENGRWKGYVVNSETERDGYFPAMAVHLLNPSKKTQSVCSSSSVASNESSGRLCTSTVSSSPEKRIEPVSAPAQPVGLVPIGSFDLVTLAQADAECHAPPKQTASGNLPTRMSSFKKNAPRPHPVAVQPPKAPVRQQSIPKSPPRSPHRPVVEDTSHTFQHGSQTLGRHSLKHRPPQQQEESRNRTSSTGSAQHGLAKALLQGLNKQQASSQKNYNQAESVSRTSPAIKQPSAVGCTTGYNTDKSNVQNTLTIHENHENNLKPILAKSKSQDSTSINNIQSSKMESGIKQNINNVKFACSPVEKRTLKLNINASFEDENAPQLPIKRENAPPQLPLKRSQTLPSSYVRPKDETDNVSPNTLSVKQRGRLALYENTDVITGSFVPPSEKRLSKYDQELMDWLTEHKLSCYYDNFKDHGFDMVSVQAITPDDLNVIDIHKTGHRKKLLSEIAKLPPSHRIPNEKPRDVGSWLGQLNLRQYEPNFVEGGFDDIDFIKDLDKNDLDMIDIKKKGHQRKLLLAVQRLNDLELTAILDQAVAESPIRRTPSFNRNNHTAEIQEFFPTFQQNMSLRDDLPPPSGEEQLENAPKHAPPTVSKKPKAPVAVPPKPGAPAPKPKPKPSVKPINKHGETNGDVTTNVGKVSTRPPGKLQGSQDEVVTSSRSRDFFKQQEQKVKEVSPPGTMERKSSNADKIAPPQPMNRRPSSGKSPVPPPAAPKPKPAVAPPATKPPVEALATTPKKLPPPEPPKRAGSLTEHATIIVPQPDLTLPPEPSAEENALSPKIPNFKPPPPPSKKSEPSPPPDFTPPPPEFTTPQDVDILPPPPDMLITEEPQPLPSPPPPEVLEPTPGTEPTPTSEPAPAVELSDPATTEPSPAIEPSEPAPVIPDQIPVEVTAAELPPEEKKDEFGETDDIMAGIMADLDDFTSQIDNLF